MGNVRKGDGAEQQGLFGYSEGAQSIFLDAKTGNATFGVSGTGQIVMKPHSGTIEGGKYNYNTAVDTKGNPIGTGMKIDLASPSITYGSGRFSVDKYGNLVAQGGGSIAGWSIGADKLSKGTVGLSSNNNPKTNKAFWAGSTVSTNAPFNVDFNGSVQMKDASIGGNVFIKDGKIYSNKHNAFNNTTEGFYLGSDGISLGADFSVDSKGSITAKKGNIAGFTIKNDKTGQAIHTAGKPTASGGEPGVYIGTGAISLGDSFMVNTLGYLISKSGNIGGWTIGAEGLYGGGASGSFYKKKNGKNTSEVLTIGVFLGTAGLRLGSNFHVDSSGNLYAVNGNFTGTIYANAGNIAGWKIGTDKLSAGKM